MNISYDLPIDDLVEFHVIHATKSPTSRKLNLLIYGLVGAAVPLGIAIYLAFAFLNGAVVAGITLIFLIL